MIQGDNDPVDVVEIGGTPLETAGVYSVKALGAYAMIDDGELDWKVICIRADNPLAPKLNDITDVERWESLAALWKHPIKGLCFGASEASLSTGRHWDSPNLSS